MNRVLPPIDLSDVDWFVVIWDRDQQQFILVLRDNSSYALADGSFPLSFFTQALKDEYLASRVLDIARNFVVSVCYPTIKEAVAAPEKFIRSKTETEILFDEKNRVPWDAITAHIRV